MRTANTHKNMARCAATATLACVLGLGLAAPAYADTASDLAAARTKLEQIGTQTQQIYDELATQTQALDQTAGEITQKQQEIAEEQQVMMNQIGDAIKTFLDKFNEEHKYAMIIATQGSVLPAPVATGDPDLDVTDAILERFARPAWKTIEDEWVRGAISARQCMERQIPLIEAPLERLDAFLDTVPVTGGFVEFVRYSRSKGIPLGIVSDGMDYPIKRI